MRRYRIKPTKSRNDYKIQCWRVWFPFWIKVGIFSMLDFSSIEKAERWLDETTNPKYYKPKETFKNP